MIAHADAAAAEDRRHQRVDGLRRGRAARPGRMFLGAERVGQALDELPHRRRQRVVELVEGRGEAVAERAARPPRSARCGSGGGRTAPTVRSPAAATPSKHVAVEREDRLAVTLGGFDREAGLGQRVEVAADGALRDAVAGRSPGPQPASGPATGPRGPAECAIGGRFPNVVPWLSSAAATMPDGAVRDMQWCAAGVQGYAVAGQL